MERRDFLKLASLAGLGVAVGLRGEEHAVAADPYTGPLWVMVNASGGWDPTYLCDPKGGAFDNDPDTLNRLYLASQIEKAGEISYAPTGNNAAFFQQFKDELLVINGIDTQTNSHDAGSRTTWAGTLIDNRPSLAALIAGHHGGSLPMAYITNGGYDYTAGVVAVTRTGNLDAITRAAFPNQIDPNNEATPLYHQPSTVDRIRTAREERYQAQLEAQRLPRIRQAMSTLYAARTGQNELAKLKEHLDLNSLNGLSNLQRQAAIAIAAYQAGICVAANLNTGGFDTHGQHDANHIPRLNDVLSGVTYLKQQADALIGGNVVIVVGSDFGRTPKYNDGNGKDHWNITSMLAMGKGIAGNRVFGATDDKHNSLKINAQGKADEGGFQLHTGHIHKALRKLAGIDGAEITKGFLLAEEEDLQLFT